MKKDHPPPPAFTSLERELLLAALNHAQDEQLAERLCVTLSAVKKRWRSIYAKVEGSLFDSESTILGGRRGPEKKRRLIEFLREHPEWLGLQETPARTAEPAVPQPSEVPGPLTHVPRRFLVPSLAAILFLVVALRSALPAADPVDGLGTLPIEEFAKGVWAESYGPNEDRVGQMLLSRWGEISAEVERRRSRPDSLASFAAPIWRAASTVNKGAEVATWLKDALDRALEMDPRVESMAAAAVSFQMNIDTAFHKNRDMVYARRAHQAALRSGDPWSIANSLRARGFAHRTSIDPRLLREGRKFYDEAYTLFNNLDDDKGLALMEACYASGGAAGDDVTNPDFRACAIWALRAYKRWQRIGNRWGQDFAALQLRIRLEQDPTLLHDRAFCAEALTIVSWVGAEAMSRSHYDEARHCIAWQTILLASLGRHQEATALAKRLMPTLEAPKAKSLNKLIQEYDSTPTDPHTREALVVQLSDLSRMLTTDSPR